MRSGFGVADLPAGYVNPASFIGNLVPDSRQLSKQMKENKKLERKQASALKLRQEGQKVLQE